MIPAAGQDDSLNLAQMREMWPRSDDGRLCARLLRRFAITKLVESSIGAECTAERAQAESGAGKAFASLVREFALLLEKQDDKPRQPFTKPLHRFQQETEPATNKPS